MQERFGRRRARRWTPWRPYARFSATNTIRGAAGASVLNAELLAAEGILA